MNRKLGEAGKIAGTTLLAVVVVALVAYIGYGWYQKNYGANSRIQFELVGSNGQIIPVTDPHSFMLVGSEGGGAVYDPLTGKSYPAETAPPDVLARYENWVQGNAIAQGKIFYNGVEVTAVRAVLYITAKTTNFSPSSVHLTIFTTAKLGSAMIMDNIQSSTDIVPNQETQVLQSIVEIQASTIANILNLGFGNYNFVVSYSGTGTAEGLNGTFSISGSLGINYTSTKSLEIVPRIGSGSLDIVR